MSSTTDLVIALLAKDAASSVLSGVGAKLDSLGKAGGMAKLAIAGLATGLGAAAAIGLDFARATADEEQGVQRMRQALTASGVNWRDYSDDIEETIFRMERLTAFSDGEMRDAMSMLVAQTGSADEAMRRLPIATDLARGAGMDLVTASKLLGKVTDENVNVLKRYGITVKEGADASDVLAEVQQRFGGQAATFAETATGKWQIFNNQVDNLKEDIGGALLPVFSGLAEVATGAIDAIRQALNTPEIQGALTAITSALGTAKDIFAELFGVITGTAPGAGEALTRAIGPDTAKMIMGAIATVRDIVKAVFGGDIPAVMATLGQRIPPLLEGILGFVGQAIPKITQALLGWAKEFIAWIAPQIPPMLNELLGLLSTALKWLGDNSEEIGRTLVDWGLQFGRFVVDVAIPKFLEYAPQIVGTIVKWAATEALPAIVRAAFNLGKGLVGGIADALADGVGALASAFGSMVRAAVSSIDFWVGPFHISGMSGITVSMPQINLPRIGLPSFAQGGSFVTAGPTPILVGDNPGGRELVTVTPLGSGRGGGRESTTILNRVYLDGRVIAEVVGDHLVRRIDALGGSFQ